MFRTYRWRSHFPSRGDLCCGYSIQCHVWGDTALGEEAGLCRDLSSRTQCWRVDPILEFMLWFVSGSDSDLGVEGSVNSRNQVLVESNVLVNLSKANLTPELFWVSFHSIHDLLMSLTTLCTTVDVLRRSTTVRPRPGSSVWLRWSHTRSDIHLLDSNPM